MEGDHTVAEELREAGDGLDEGGGDARLVEERGRSAARDELDAELAQPAGEHVEPALVPTGKKRSADHPAISSRTTRGRSRRSTACTRARSVATSSPGSTGTHSLAITAPVSIPSST